MSQKATVAPARHSSRRLPGANENLGFGLLDAGRLYARCFQHYSDQLALDLTHSRMLLTLAENEGVTPQRLAELTRMYPAAVGRVLATLELCGWIERNPRVGDRHPHSCALTFKARGLVPHLRNVANQSQCAALEGLSAAETQLLATALGRVLANLRAYRPGSSAARVCCRTTL
jgi:DNA-binding MarR family transcriptional regulator